jgi:hypothetical protein
LEEVVYPAPLDYKEVYKSLEKHGDDEKERIRLLGNDSFDSLINKLCNNHRLSINRPTKRGKEKFPSDRHCQCEKEMDNNLLARQQIFEKEPHSDPLC